MGPQDDQIEVSHSSAILHGDIMKIALNGSAYKSSVEVDSP